MYYITYVLRRGYPEQFFSHTHEDENAPRKRNHEEIQHDSLYKTKQIYPTPTDHPPLTRTQAQTNISKP